MINTDSLDKARVVHSIKTAFACLIGYIVTKFTNLPVDQWLIITILVVMCAQVNVGSMLQKSYMRFLGTLLGSLVAALTLLLLGASNEYAIGFILCLAAMFFSYMATSPGTTTESGTLGAVTTTIILISPHPTLMTAVERFSEISGGILIAALVSQFVLPIHARNLLQKKQAQTLRQLKAYYLATLLTDQNEQDIAKYHEIDVEITKSLITQRKLATEALREPFAHKSIVVTQFAKSLSCEREMLRAITFMHHAYRASPESKKIFSSMDVLHKFHDKICNAFDKIIFHFENKLDQALVIEIPTVDTIKNAITLEKNNLSADDIIYTNAYLFCSEVLVAQLHDLINCLRI